MIRVFSTVAVFVLSCAPVLEAQLATSIALNKRNYIAGESVIAEVTITNHSGQNLTLASTRQLPWLSFLVTNSRGNPVPTSQLNTFGVLEIEAGQSLAKRVDLTQYFILNSQGNYAVTAVIRDPRGSINGASTNRILFNLNPGRTYWTQKIGVENEAGALETREMKLITFSNGQKNQLFAQVVDGRTGVPMSTFSLGDALMLRKPKVTLDGNRRMHVMFLATPTIWVHCQVDTNGKLVERDLHKRPPNGDPVLMAYGDGTVGVVNSIPYDPEAERAERAKVRGISDRPDFLSE
jgi:hypothetical protein